MTNTYKDDASLEEKTYQELSSAFVDYQMEKFGKDYETEKDKKKEKKT